MSRLRPLVDYLKDNVREQTGAAQLRLPLQRATEAATELVLSMTAEPGETPTLRQACHRLVARGVIDAQLAESLASWVELTLWKELRDDDAEFQSVVIQIVNDLDRLMTRIELGADAPALPTSSKAPPPSVKPMRSCWLEVTDRRVAIEEHLGQACVFVDELRVPMTFRLRESVSAAYADVEDGDRPYASVETFALAFAPQNRPNIYRLDDGTVKVRWMSLEAANGFVASPMLTLEFTPGLASVAVELYQTYNA